MTQHLHLDAPSPWIVRHVPLIAPASVVLDVACGRGRHARWLAQHGWKVEAVDRDADALAALAAVPGVATRCADLEGGPWPFPQVRFAGVVVANYLHRPLLAQLAAALAPGGVLIYETFMSGNERFGKPSNPDFLLRPHELLDFTRSAGLQVVAFEQGETSKPKAAVVQRICAAKTSIPLRLAGD